MSSASVRKGVIYQEPNASLVDESLISCSYNATLDERKENDVTFSSRSYLDCRIPKSSVVTYIQAQVRHSRGNTRGHNER